MLIYRQFEVRLISWWLEAIFLTLYTVIWPLFLEV